MNTHATPVTTAEVSVSQRRPRRAARCGRRWSRRSDPWIVPRFSRSLVLGYGAACAMGAGWGALAGGLVLLVRFPPIFPVGAVVGGWVGFIVGAAIGLVIAPLLGLIFRSRWSRRHSVVQVARLAAYWAAVATLVVTETPAALIESTRERHVLGLIFGLVATGSAAGLGYLVAWRLQERR